MNIHGVNPSSSPTSSAGRRRAAEPSGAKWLAHHARELNAYVTEGMRTLSNVEETELSSRKITWVESIKTHFKKIKHRIIVAFCSMRLHCHFYLDDDTRKELKRSVRQAENELKILDSEQQRMNNVERMKEQLEDGEYGKAAKSAFEAGCHGLREGFCKMRKNIAGNQ